MNLVVNGASRAVPGGTTVADLVASVVDSTRGVAVAVDGVVVPRSGWGDRELEDGQAVEILTAAAGG